MANVFDVAAHILDRCGPMTTWKLQKLVYYAQAWSLVWNDDVLFDEEIEAWANGPVVRELYNAHRGAFRLTRVRGGEPKNLTENEQATIKLVVAFYGDKSPQWLSDLTHMEEPWKRAREGIPDGQRGRQIISKEHLAEYYSSLLDGAETR